LRFDAVALKNDVTQSIKELSSEISGIDSQVQENTKALIKKAEKSEVFGVVADLLSTLSIHHDFLHAPFQIPSLAPLDRLEKLVKSKVAFHDVAIVIRALIK
jgi:hypothetical protein